MKKSVLAIVAIAALLTGCANSKVINGKEYPAYGLANQDELKDANITYKIPLGNFAMAAIFSETLVVPGYIVLFDLFEPVQLKPNAQGTEKK